jgi:hypothetical protein
MKSLFYHIAFWAGVGVWIISVPELRAQAFPEPPAAIDAPTANSNGANNGVNILTRGPIHEAIAQPINTGKVETLIVPKRPPEPIDEVAPDAKPDDETAVWIPGYWAWDDDQNDFLWVSGVWRVPPPNRQWVPGYWTQVTNGYQWVPGFWSDLDKQQVDYYPEPPASLERGPSSDPPSADDFWIPGCWRWEDNRYVWQAGYWAAGRDDWVLQPASYYSSPLGWVFVNSYWDYPLAERGMIFAPVRFANYRYNGEFTPSVAIDAGLLSFYLFNRPDYGHYYFGDYFARSYDRLGIYPWYQANAFRNFTYDPLFTYYRWHNRTRDPHWADNLRGWHDYYRVHADERPPHDLAAQQQLIRRGGDRPDRQYLPIADTLDNWRRKPDLPFRIATVPADERNRIRETTRNLADFRNERTKTELQSHTGAISNLGSTPNTLPSPVPTLKSPTRATLPKSPTFRSAKGASGAEKPSAETRGSVKLPQIPVPSETRPAAGIESGRQAQNRNNERFVPRPPPVQGGLTGEGKNRERPRIESVPNRPPEINRTPENVPREARRPERPQEKPRIENPRVPNPGVPIQRSPRERSPQEKPRMDHPPVPAQHAPPQKTPPQEHDKGTGHNEPKQPEKHP